MRARASILATAMATLACTPEIDTDPVPAVMEFDTAARPPRVAEPMFILRDPITNKIDLGLGGIEVPADCSTQPALARAQCEFNQYLETLDGFPTATTARTPVSAPVDLPTATVPTNVVVIDSVSRQPISQVAVGFDGTNRYLTVGPTRSWAVGSFPWIGVRGYDAGIRAQGKPVVASVVYNLLKRDEPLTCGAASAAEIPASCPYFQLLAQQMPPDMARKNLGDLELLRRAMAGGGAWSMVEQAGIPKAQAAMLWGFPVHTNPVIDLNPPAGLVPQAAGADEIRLAVNGTLDPATVKPWLIGQAAGTVLLLDLDALAEPPGTAPPFPMFNASYADGRIVVKANAPLRAGKRHGLIVTRGVKDTEGRALVPPPLSVLLMARGPLLDPATSKSTVSSVGDAEAAQLEAGRQGLAMLLDDPSIEAFGIRRAEIAYLFALTWGTP